MDYIGIVAALFIGFFCGYYCAIQNIKTYVKKRRIKEVSDCQERIKDAGYDIDKIKKEIKFNDECG